MSRRLLLGAALLAGAFAVPLPTCDDEVGANCVGEDADLSPEGINTCLEGLSEKSELCTTYLLMMKACKTDMADGGVCGEAAMNGEAMPCLVQRTKPEDLSEACRATIKVEELKGLAKYWADGKRALNIDEISELNVDDKDTYTRWQKKKKGKKTDKDKERDYAVKAAKRERVEGLIAAAVKEGKPSTVAEATKIAEGEAQKAIDEDMTGTLKSFTKPQSARRAAAANSPALMLYPVAPPISTAHDRARVRVVAPCSSRHREEGLQRDEGRGLICAAIKSCAASSGVRGSTPRPLALPRYRPHSKTRLTALTRAGARIESKNAKKVEAFCRFKSQVKRPKAAQVRNGPQNRDFTPPPFRRLRISAPIEPIS